MHDIEPASAVLVLQGPLTVREIAAVRDRLLEALSAQQSVQIDCSRADSVDLSFIQLLLSAHKTAQQAGKRLMLAAPANGVLRAALAAGGFATAAPDPFWSGGA